MGHATGVREGGGMSKREKRERERERETEGERERERRELRMCAEREKKGGRGEKDVEGLYARLGEETLVKDKIR